MDDNQDNKNNQNSHNEETLNEKQQPPTDVEQTQTETSAQTQPNRSITEVLTETPNSKKGFPKILLIGVFLVLIMAFIAGAYYYLWNSKQTSNVQEPVSTETQEIPSPTPNPTADWETFEDEEKIFKFKYPSNFLTDQENNNFIIFSESVNCKTGVTGSEREISINEVKIRTGLRSGESYVDIWKNTFGYEFNSSSYDREITTDGKKGYYFYQGAESPIGKQFILIEISDQKALEIVIEKPALVYDCTGSINKYEGVADQILSTFEFVSEN